MKKDNSKKEIEDDKIKVIADLYLSVQTELEQMKQNENDIKNLNDMIKKLNNDKREATKKLNKFSKNKIMLDAMFEKNDLLKQQVMLYIDKQNTTKNKKNEEQNKNK